MGSRKALRESELRGSGGTKGRLLGLLLALPGTLDKVLPVTAPACFGGEASIKGVTLPVGGGMDILMSLIPRPAGGGCTLPVEAEFQASRAAAVLCCVLSELPLFLPLPPSAY